MDLASLRGTTSRRTILAAATLALALVGLGTAGVYAQNGPTEIPTEELAKSGADLPDLELGSPDAKITIVEYASMTCGHCMHFHTTVLPDLKKKYIDTGKVRLIFREFPLDARAFAASMLARCVGGDKTFALISALFERQGDWAFKEENQKDALFEVAKQAGFTREAFDKCLTDQKLLDQLTAIRTRASDVFGVSATPTLFINGKKFTSAPTIEEISKVIDPLVAAG